jgi:hypothetical protein
LLVGALSAQSAPHTKTIPEVASGTFFGSSSAFPLAQTGGKAQYWFRRDGLEVGVVTAIGPRPRLGLTATGRSMSVEITMANTSIAHAAFTNNFAQNLGATPTIVYARKMFTLPSITNHQDPEVPTFWFALDAPFPLIGPHLVLDFDLGTTVGQVATGYSTDLLVLSQAPAST